MGYTKEGRASPPTFPHVCQFANCPVYGLLALLSSPPSAPSHSVSWAARVGGSQLDAALLLGRKSLCGVVLAASVRE